MIHTFIRDRKVFGLFNRTKPRLVREWWFDLDGYHAIRLDATTQEQADECEKNILDFCEQYHCDRAEWYKNAEWRNGPLSPEEADAIS